MFTNPTLYRVRERRHPQDAFPVVEPVVLDEPIDQPTDRLPGLRYRRPSRPAISVGRSGGRVADLIRRLKVSVEVSVEGDFVDFDETSYVGVQAGSSRQFWRVDGSIVDVFGPASPAVTFVMVMGKPERAPWLSPMTRERIWRYASAIAALGRGLQENGRRINIMVIPDREQLTLGPLAGWEPELPSAWWSDRFEHVKEVRHHSRNVASYFNHLLRLMLGHGEVGEVRRHLGDESWPKPADIHPLLPARDPILRSREWSRLAPLEMLVDKLRRKGNPLWGALLEQRLPETYGELLAMGRRLGLVWLASYGPMIVIGDDGDTVPLVDSARYLAETIGRDRREFKAVTLDPMPLVIWDEAFHPAEPAAAGAFVDGSGQPEVVSLQETGNEAGRVEPIDDVFFRAYHLPPA